MREALALFACPASQDGLDFGPEMAQRVKGAIELLKQRLSSDLLIVSGASGYKPNDLYSKLVLKRVIDAGIDGARIVVGGPAASTVGEIDRFESLARSSRYEKIHIVALSYQIHRTRFIWWRKYRRHTIPASISVNKVPKDYLLIRYLMEPVKFVLYFVLPTSWQDKANHEILGPRGL